jgi:hypothetical protein
MKSSWLFRMCWIGLFACGPSSTDLGTDVGNAFDSSLALTEEAEEGVFGIISEDDVADSPTGITRRPKLFAKSPLRGSCPSSSREQSGSTVSIRREFNSCRPFRKNNKLYDGETLIEITRNAGDDRENNVFDREGSIARDIEISMVGGRKRIIEDRNSFTTSGTYPSSIVHEVAIDSTRILKSSRGEVVSRPRSQGTLTYNFSGSSEVDQVVLNGQLSVSNPTLQASGTTEYDSVKWVETCCHPISGGFNQNLEVAGKATSREVIYGPACGQISIDGVSYTLESCE